MKKILILLTSLLPPLEVLAADNPQHNEELRRDVYRLILHKESWILTEHLESAADAFMPFLNDDELTTWDWSVRKILDDIDIEEIQLDRSERKEVVIQTHARTYCGSGGCNAHILKLDGDEPRYIGTFFYNGNIIKPLITETRIPDSGFYDFAIQGSNIDVYRYNTAKEQYTLK